MATSVELLKLLVRQVLDHRLQFGRVEKVIADVGTGLDGVFLILAVDHFTHAAHQSPRIIFGEKLIPLAAPDDFDDVPASSTECRFELLDDLRVASNRTVEPLQIAVHHECQIVEVLARGERDRAERFRFVDLTVAQKRPDVGF